MFHYIMASLSSLDLGVVRAKSISFKIIIGIKEQQTTLVGQCVPQIVIQMAVTFYRQHFVFA